MLSYEQYPEEKSRLWLSSFKKKLINLRAGGLLDLSTNIYLKSCTYMIIQIPSAAPSFMGI